MSSSRLSLWKVCLVALLTAVTFSTASAQSSDAKSIAPSGGIQIAETFLLDGATIYDYSPYDAATNAKGQTVFAEGGLGLSVNLGQGSASNVATPLVPPLVLGIAVDRSGAFWYADARNNAIGILNTTTGKMKEYILPSGTVAGGIALGSDGAMWFPAFSSSVAPEVGRIASDGTITTYPIPQMFQVNMGIATGADGNVWVSGVDNEGNEQVAKITPTGESTVYVTESNCVGTLSLPSHAVAAGPDGNVWFVSECGVGIGKITPAGAATIYPITTSPPMSLVAGSDGAIWFTDSLLEIGRITTDGVVTYTAVPDQLRDYRACSSLGGVTQIVAGPKGTLEFFGGNANFCSYLASFTPTAPEGVQPRKIERDQPSSDDRVSCANNQICVLTAYPAATIADGGGANVVAVSLKASYINDGTYQVGLQPGPNFGKCNVYYGGNPVYGTEGGVQIGGSGNIIYYAEEFTGFSAGEYGLEKGQKFGCSFPFQLVQYSNSGGEMVLATTAITVTYIVGPS